MDLVVYPQYLLGLGEQQQQLIKDLDQTYVSMSSDLWWTHGPLCGYSNTTMGQLEVLRAAVIAGEQAIAEALADYLSVGSRIYAKTEERTGDNLDSQMLDR